MQNFKFAPICPSTGIRCAEPVMVLSTGVPHLVGTLPRQALDLPLQCSTGPKLEGANPNKLKIKMAKLKFPQMLPSNKLGSGLDRKSKAGKKTPINLQSVEYIAND